MKKKNYVLVVLLGLIVTGCSNVSYNLDINLDSNYENLTFNHNNIEGINDIIDSNITADSVLSSQDVTYETNSSEVKIYNNFDNIEYLVNNPALASLYNKVEVINDEGIITVTFSDYNKSMFECGEFDESCDLTLDEIKFNLSSEYEIVSTNADIQNSKNNKYTWIFNSESRNKIYFSYSDEIRWDVVIKNFIIKYSNEIFACSTGVVIIIAIIVFTCKFLKAMKENNS